jgi:hypothetical protein
LISVISNTIQVFYIQEKVPKLLSIIKQKTHLPWDHRSLESAVKNLGYKWRKCQPKRKILVGRADTDDWRSRYLVKIKECQDKGYQIFYDHSANFTS